LYHRYTPERLEKKAEEILLKYKGGLLLTSPQAMDVDDFAEFHCNATIDFANLSQDGNTLGCSCFNDGVLMVWDDTRTRKISLDVQKDNIFIDKGLLDGEIEERIRFTIIHECSHLILHPRFLYQKPGSVIPKIDCAVYHIEKWTKRPPMSDEEIREWQANRLGAALIMPAKTVRILMAERLSVTVKELAAVYVSEIFIKEMAVVFVVSKSAMHNRLRDLDLLLQ
jgi:hypothetical protein